MKDIQKQLMKNVIESNGEHNADNIEMMILQRHLIEKVIASLNDDKIDITRAILKLSEAETIGKMVSEAIERQSWNADNIAEVHPDVDIKIKNKDDDD